MKLLGEKFIELGELIKNNPNKKLPGLGVVSEEELVKEIQTMIDDLKKLEVKHDSK